MQRHVWIRATYIVEELCVKSAVNGRYPSVAQSNARKVNLQSLQD